MARRAGHSACWLTWAIAAVFSMGNGMDMCANTNKRHEEVGGNTDKLIEGFAGLAGQAKKDRRSSSKHIHRKGLALGKVILESRMKEEAATKMREEVSVT